MSQSFTTEISFGFLSGDVKPFIILPSWTITVSRNGGVYICDVYDSMQIWETIGSHSEFLSPVENSSVRIFMVHGLAVMVAYGKLMDLILNFLSILDPTGNTFNW